MHEPRPVTTTATRPPALHRRGAVAVALLASLLATMLGGARPGTAAPADALEGLATRVVVEAQAGLGQVVEAVADRGGRVVDVIAPFGIVVADVPGGSVDELEADPATGAVTPDVPLQVQSADVGSAARTTVAGTSDPDAGDGVGVVVVDTGIAAHGDLGERVVARYALAPGGDDAHGHGTFLAGLVAGSGAASGGRFAGVAPAAHLVSVRVADADGATTLVRVLHGLAVADVARERHDAPVVLLALSGPTGEVPDPVMMVLEMLWARGSTVVVAAGNDGEVGSPGADPYLLTAGALDDQGTADPADDAVPAWSAAGPTPWGHAKPDLVAPGVSVVGLRAAGSAIDRAHPEARVDEQYFRGTGTSMSAALTAGAAAAVLAAHPGLTPDEVKGRLLGSAAPAPAGAAPAATGAGVLDVTAALRSDAPPANTELAPLPTPRGNTTGSARAIAPGQLRRTADGLQPSGWSFAGWSWAGWSWADQDWAGWSWADQDWTGWSWAGGQWSGWSWAGWSWADQDWAGWSWAGWSWAGWSWAATSWDAGRG